MFSAAAELKSKHRGRQGSSCSHQVFCWNLMAEKLHVWKTSVQAPLPGPGLCPDTTRDTGTQLCPFTGGHVCLSLPLCTGVTDTELSSGYCRRLITGLKGRVHCLFCAIPRAKSLKPHKRATPCQFKVSHTFHLPFAEYQSWNILV